MGADPMELELEDTRILEEAEILLHLGNTVPPQKSL